MDYFRQIHFKTNQKHTAIRRIALAMCVIFIAVSLFSAAYIITQANHTHDHNGPDGSCVTCAHLALAGNLLRSISAVVVGSAPLWGGLFVVLSICKPHYSYGKLNTLVHLKVKLNN
ncbi:hypothetical protein Ami103574_05480 [Aminipila butyrica]|uniref:Uncharacterized protein n=1 Tax=Aminipila butyrica TaxID=433296 RepID=A0A858BVL5_9FIRM|nr:hypothetical protein [Aminipila butyrica]QIB68804.1 hypothetical protein Ami103574_05480 [Aminipila butyrica]